MVHPFAAARPGSDEAVLHNVLVGLQPGNRCVSPMVGQGRTETEESAR